MDSSLKLEFFVETSKQILRAKGFKVDESKLFNGAFGYVFFIEDSLNNKMAAKAISLNNYIKGDKIIPKILSEASSEASMMKDLRHPNIIKYISHFQQGSTYFIIMERALDNLDNYIKQNFSNDNITEELFFVSQFFHKKGIIIRDFKPANILVFPNNVLKLCDLGLTKRFSPLIVQEEYKQSQIKGTYLFHPPEIMQSIISSSLKEEQIEAIPVNQTMKGDIWALGISLLNLLGIQPLASIALSCGEKEFESQPNASLKMNQFLNHLMKKNLEERPTIENLKQKLCDLFPQYKSNLLMKRAILLRDKEFDFEEAEQLLREAIQIYPTNSRAYSHLALSFYRRSDSLLFPKVKENVEKALEIDPFNEEAIILSSLEIITNDKQAQENLKQIALKINYPNPFVLNWIGREFYDDNNFDGAEDYFKKAIEADENFGRAYYFMGDIFFRKNMLDNARDWYEKGIGRDISNSLFLSGIAKTYLKQNQQSVGEGYFRIAIQSNPRCIFSKSEYGMVLLNDKKYQQALPYFKDVVYQSPGNSGYRFTLGNILYNLNQYSEAEEHMRQSINISKDKDNLFLLGLITEKQGKKEECCKSFEQAIQLDPKDARVYWYYAQSLETFQSLKEALSYFEESERLNPHELTVKKIKNLKKKIKQ